MSQPVGGLRHRLVNKSVYEWVKAGLGGLGWFNPGRAHTTINVVARQYHLDEEVPINTVAVSTGNVTPADIELGSGLAEYVTELYVDVYGQNDSVASHLADDVVDLLAGRSIQILNWSLATPVPIFTVEVESPRRDRAREFPHPWQRHWYVVRAELVDTYDPGAS